MKANPLKFTIRLTHNNEIVSELQGPKQDLIDLMAFKLAEQPEMMSVALKAILLATEIMRMSDEEKKAENQV